MQGYVDKANEWKATFQTNSLPYVEELVVRALYHYPIYLTSTLIPELQEEGGDEEFILSLETEIAECYQLIERIIQHQAILPEWYRHDASTASLLGQACVHFLTCDDEWIRDRISAQSRLLGLLSVFQTDEEQKFLNHQWCEALKYNLSRYRDQQENV